MLNPRGRRSVASEEQGCALRRSATSLSRHEAGSKGAAVRQVDFRDESCGICEGVERKVSGTPAPLLAEAREWLAFCGQMEQAALDAGANGNPYAEATDAAVPCCWTCGTGSLPRTPGHALSSGSGRLQRCPQRPGDVPRAGRFRVVCALSEAYAQTADIWAAEQQNRNAARLLVIGLRSIGTALGAVVAEALRRREKRSSQIVPQALRAPFAREVSLGDAEFCCDAALIVDEGPGLSGSSMAAAAEALAQRGFPSDRIFFLRVMPMDRAMRVVRRPHAGGRRIGSA